MTGEELNILSKIKVRPVEEQRDFLLEQNMLLTGKNATLEKENAELKKKCYKKAVKDYCKLEKENRAIKSLLYCTERSCNNCGKVNCENFQRQRIDCCGLWVSYKDYIAELEKKNGELKARLNAINLLTPELEKMSKLKKQQLTKAKELLKKIEKIVYSGENATKRLSKIVDVLAEVEQFLNGDGCPDCFCEDCTKEDCGIRKLK